jgi:hypothetical protein
MKKNRKNKLKAILIFLLLMVGVPVIIYSLIGQIKISKIECQSQFGPCRQELFGNLVSLEGNSIYFVKNNIKSTFSDELFVEEYNIRYFFPGILRVYLLERKAHFALKSETEGAALISSDAMVLAITESTVLPVITVEGELPQKGTQVDSNTLFALKLMQRINHIYGVTLGRLVDGNLHVDVESVNFWFPDSGEEDVIIGSMIIVLDKLKSGEIDILPQTAGGKIQVDLRFDNPVIRSI